MGGKKWHDRYFVLYEGWLAYWETLKQFQAKKSCKGLINLSDCSLATPTPLPTLDRNRDRSTSVVCLPPLSPTPRSASCAMPVLTTPVFLGNRVQ